ncbi:glycosyltransferase family 4 protein [Bremerella sp. TYQ1]|uniref:glycosyltransferase family 4 protein n=1 Tax=Bremerella sp. TYQ1 TaxID=3119568 RepID=UPI001CCC92FF|nr:glycosyltransferase family 4 protein [Bremerella volcania]UBM35007.1 glycosyltransferase family 4 protein [Bremerella volcania]
MTSLRLALVTRRFWPLVGGAEMVMANLAEELTQQGHQVQIVTAQWHPDWPKQITHRGIPVIRLPNPSVRGWGTVRYMMALGRWLRSHEQDLDAVYVSMLKHSAVVATSRFLNSNVPVVLRAEGAGETGDCAFHESANFGQRIRRSCQQADGFVAPSQQIFDEMAAAQFDRDKIRFIPNGVKVGPLKTDVQRQEARKALATANPILTLAESAPLVVFTGRLHPGKGLTKLVRAWPRVLQRFPMARLWLIGEGPQEGELSSMIGAMGLQSRILLPGAFDTVEDVLAAADAFVLPSLHEGMSIALLEAMVANLPCVVSDIPGNRILIDPEETGLIFPVDEIDRLADQLIRILENQDLSRQLGTAARKRVIEHFSLKRNAEDHVALFHSLMETKRLR